MQLKKLTFSDFFKKSNLFRIFSLSKEPFFENWRPRCENFWPPTPQGDDRAHVELDTFKIAGMGGGSFSALVGGGQKFRSCGEKIPKYP